MNVVFPVVGTYVLYCLLFTAKTGCDAIKNKRHFKHLKAFPSLQLGDRKNPQVILLILPEARKITKKQRKRIKQEHQKIRTKVHQY